jgi:hypothetical protein
MHSNPVLRLFVWHVSCFLPTASFTGDLSWPGETVDHHQLLCSITLSTQKPAFSVARFVDQTPHASLSFLLDCRTHQYEAVEQFIMCSPEESSGLMQELLANAEDFYQALGLPYRVVNIAPGG